MMKGEVTNQSRMLVSGNSEAKAKHFNNTKMELSNLKQEQVKNLNKIAQFEKQDAANLKVSQQVYKDVIALVELSYDKAGMTLPLEKKTEFKISQQALHSTQISLNKIAEGVSMCKGTFGQNNPFTFKSMTQEALVTDVSLDNIENPTRAFANSTKKFENQNNKPQIGKKASTVQNSKAKANLPAFGKK